MARVLIVDSDETWQQILKCNIEPIISPGIVDAKGDHQSVDRLLGLTQNCANPASYDIFVINAYLRRSQGGEIIPYLGIELALQIARTKRLPRDLFYITSYDPDALDRARKEDFENLYLRGPPNTHYVPEKELYHDLRLYLEHLALCTSPK